jgi:hypothetical protein
MTKISSYSFPQVYEDLGIKTGNLGCIMLDTQTIEISDIIDDASHLYYSPNKDSNYIDGIVSEKIPHVTLLYGLMRSGPEMQKHVEAVLDDWTIPELMIDRVDFFESTDPEEPYYCLVAKLVPSQELVEGNSRLRLLPHIDTFPDYDPHITLAYIKKDETLRDSYIDMLNTKLKGMTVVPYGVNYGD